MKGNKTAKAIADNKFDDCKLDQKINEEKTKIK